MKDSIAALDKLVKDRAAEKEQLAKDIDTIKERVEAANKAAQAAAAAGNLDGYKAAQAEAAAFGDQLTVCKAHLHELETTSPISEGQAALAWQNYSAQYNKQFDAKLAQYEKIKQELLTVYAELIDIEAAAFATRERIAVNSGLDKKAQSLFDKPLDLSFPCKCLPDKSDTSGPQLGMPGTIIKNEDALFYLIELSKRRKVNAMGFVNDPDIQKVTDIILRHSTKPFK